MTKLINTYAYSPAKLKGKLKILLITPSILIQPFLYHICKFLYSVTYLIQVILYSSFDHFFSFMIYFNQELFYLIQTIINFLIFNVFHFLNNYSKSNNKIYNSNIDNKIYNSNIDNKTYNKIENEIGSKIDFEIYESIQYNSPFQKILSSQIGFVEHNFDKSKIHEILKQNYLKSSTLKYFHVFRNNIDNICLIPTKIFKFLFSNFKFTTTDNHYETKFTQANNFISKILLYLFIAILSLLSLQINCTEYEPNLTVPYAQDNITFYTYESIPKSWYAARDYCKLTYYNGSLVSINSTSENNLIRLLHNSDTTWIGLRYSPTNSSWSDGSNFEYTDWDVLEPSYYCSIGLCMECVSYSGLDTKWMTNYCHELFPFSCKFPLSCFNKDPQYSCGTGECVSYNKCKCPIGHALINNACEPCIEGYYCDDNGMHYCPDGYWSERNIQFITDCESCESLYACKNGSKIYCDENNKYYINTDVGHPICYYCPEGYYIWKEDEKRACELCPIGHYCPGDGNKYNCTGSYYSSEEGSVSCSECLPGNYISLDQILCESCNQFEICINGINITVCNELEYYPGYGSNCLPCPDDSVCINGEKFTCDPGTFLDSNACIVCPMGYYCPGNGKKYKCNEKNYTTEVGRMNCSICPQEHYIQGYGIYCFECFLNSHCPDGITVTQCDMGYYYAPDSNTSCIICPKGYYCVYGQKFHCLEGTYADLEGMSFCKNCLPGTYNSYSIATSESDCLYCPKGSYSESSSSSMCKLCPPGTYGNITGSTSRYNCHECPPTTYQPIYGASDISYCLPCQEGTYNDKNGSIYCSECLPGFYSLGASTNCIPCSPGSYSVHNKSVECILCPPSTFNPYENASSISYCQNCTFGGNPDYGGKSEEDCDRCGPGYYLENTECKLCGYGTYSDESNSEFCKKCPKGTYQNSTGANSINKCLPCPKGSINDKEAMSECIQCTIGTYMPDTGSSGPCLQCDYGYFSNEGASNCEICPLGTIIKEETRECYPCPTGSYSVGYFSKECSLCPTGSYSDKIGSDACLSCPAGSYNPELGASSLDDCISCPLGTYSSSTGKSLTHCLACPLGHYCETPGVSKPKTCPRGTYNPNTGVTTRSGCIDCPKGSYGPIEAAISILNCISCPNGFYSEVEKAITVDVCQRCPSGTYSNTFRASNISACTPCPPGHYSIDAGETCTPCPVGTYTSNNGSSSIVDCIKCSQSSTTKKAGSTDESDCFTCEKGFYLTSSLNCEPCPKGTYFDPEIEYNRGVLTTSDSCVGCGPGYYQPVIGIIGNISCVPCEYGKYSINQKSPECLPCGSGYYSNITKGDSKDSCNACPMGTWSELEISDTIFNCIPCPPGTYNNKTGSPSSKECLLCPPGTMTLFEGENECYNCTFGFDCNSLGNSFSTSSLIYNEQKLDIFDPKTLITYSIDGYTFMKFFIPYVLLGIIVLSFILLACSMFLIFRKLNAIKGLDFFYRFRHHLMKNELQKNNPTLIGAILSISIIVAFFVMFSNLSIDFFGNNKIVFETFMLENEVITKGNFYFEIIISGSHSICNGSVTMSGFKLGSEEFSCRQDIFYGIEYSDIGEIPVPGCFCSYTCVDCEAIDLNIDITFKFSGYLLSRKLYFATFSPHFIPLENYISNGSISSFDTIFTGSSPHIISLSLNPVRHISIPHLAAVYDAAGMNIPIVERNGYVIQVSTIVPGSLQNPNIEFSPQEGMIVKFELVKSLGVLISEERQNVKLVTYLMQIITALSAIISTGAIIIQVIDAIYIRTFKKVKIEKIIPKKKKTKYVEDFTSLDWEQKEMEDVQSLSMLEFDEYQDQNSMIEDKNKDNLSDKESSFESDIEENIDTKKPEFNLSENLNVLNFDDVIKKNTIEINVKPNPNQISNQKENDTSIENSKKIGQSKENLNDIEINLIETEYKEILRTPSKTQNPTFTKAIPFNEEES